MTLQVRWQHTLHREPSPIITIGVTVECGATAQQTDDEEDRHRQPRSFAAPMRSVLRRSSKVSSSDTRLATMVSGRMTTSLLFSRLVQQPWSKRRPTGTAHTKYLLQIHTSCQ